MSSFTWLDYSEHERRRALDVISLFQVQDTRDELGLSTIRDALAERLFPGTSTIQTRARYFLFVPWTFLQLERKGTPSEKLGQRLRWQEEELVEILKDSADSDGAIGKEAGRAVKRMPSSVYWSGLKRWGILSFQGSYDQYRRGLDQFYVRVRGHRALSAENREATPEPSNWHPHLPAPPEDFPAGQSMALTQEEAVYLRERVLTTCSGSLLAQLADRAETWDDVGFAWHHPHVGGLAAQLRDDLSHAQTFSEVMHGAAILYNLMLAREAGGNHWLATHETAFEEWAERETDAAGDRATWDLTAFWRLATAMGARIPHTSRDFVEAWVRAVRAATRPQDLKDDKAAQSLIRQREYATKKGRARLASRRHLELWNGSSGAGQLDLRWGITQRLLLDIHGALPGARGGRSGA